MLEFTKVFYKGQIIGIDDVDAIIMCKNIDFGHVDWLGGAVFYNDTKCMFHIIDNIVDVNVHDGGDDTMYTFFTKIIQYSIDLHIVHYMLNNSCINDESFELYFDLVAYTQHKQFCRCCPHKQFDKLANYLTKVSFGRFRGYYNIERYYDMLHTMLLIMKAQQKLPITVIKHLIIPFIYQ